MPTVAILPYSGLLLSLNTPLTVEVRFSSKAFVLNSGDIPR